MTLQDFAQIAALSGKTHADKIRLLAWFFHTQSKAEFFGASDLKSSYETLHFAAPASFHPFLSQMASKKPPDLLQSKKGYKLESRLREKLDSAHGQRQSAIAVDSLLTNLPSLVPEIAEREYLDEAFKCFRSTAFRATIVMAWNMAFAHLCHWIYTKHLSEFNQQLPKSFPKADIQSISKQEHFSELKESQILQVAKSANIISGSLYKLLKEKLDRRNISAHPSGLVVSQLTAEEFIKDIVENVVLKLN